jgi:hypothetical protein
MFVHRRTGTTSHCIQDLYTLCSGSERALDTAFFSRYVHNTDTGDLTPFIGIGRTPVQVSEAVEWPVLPRHHEQIDVAVSGGIDSWTLAAMLKKRGHEVRAWYLESGVEGYCERTQVRMLADAVGIRCEPMHVTAADFVELLPEFVEITGMPIYNLHPVSKLLLAKGLAQRGVKCVVTGDGADQAMRHEWNCDLLPLTTSCFDAAGVQLICPLAVPPPGGPYRDKEPIRSLARSLGIPDVQKRGTYFPEITLPEGPRPQIPIEESSYRRECVACTMGLLLASVEARAECAASPA